MAYRLLFPLAALYALAVAPVWAELSISHPTVIDTSWHGHEMLFGFALAELQLRYLRERLQLREMDLELSAAALDLLAEAGFDPVYGARPLKRAILQQVEMPLAREIVAGKFGPGDSKRVDAQNDVIVFHHGETATLQPAG
jgi:hypothetical protein